MSVPGFGGTLLKSSLSVTLLMMVSNFSKSLNCLVLTGKTVEFDLIFEVA